MKLSGNQVESLQNALLAAFSFDELRQMVRTKLGMSLDGITQSNDQKVTIFDLIEWSERYGKLADLVSGATQSNPDNPTLKAWRLKYELFTHLYHLALSAEQLKEVYFKSKAKTILSETIKIDFDKPDAVVDALCEMAIQPQTNYDSSPIIAFAQRLIYLTHKRDELQAWILEAYPVLAPTLMPADLQAMQSEIEGESNLETGEAYAYLMVEVAPDGIYESDQYDIEFTLWNGDGKEVPVQPDPHEPARRIKKANLYQLLPKLLTKILDQSHLDWRASRLILEFSLPFELFSLNVHEWEDDNIEDRFGAEHPIHVRSWERFQYHKKSDRKATRIKARWYECWNYFSAQHQICQFHDDHIFWLETEMIEQCHDPNTWANLFDTEKDKHCVTFTFDPCQFQTRERAIEILRRMTLFAGLLGTVWIREACPLEAATPEIKQHIVHSLGETHIRQMGQALKTRRKQHRRTPGHIANHLMVMWDPPERIPAKYQPQANFV